MFVNMAMRSRSPIGCRPGSAGDRRRVATDRGNLGLFFPSKIRLRRVGESWAALAGGAGGGPGFARRRAIP